MNPLSQLRDIQVPKPVSFWPLAPGWYILAVLIIAIIVALVLFLWRRKKQFNPQQYALVALDKLKQADPRTHTDAGFLAEVTSLLKRRLFADCPRDEIASLHGQAWLDFLDKKSRTNDYTQGVGQVLASGPYQANISVNRSQLLNVVEQLIKSC